MSEFAPLVTCLTPRGTGAIAVLGLRGAQAWQITRELFRPGSGKPLPESPALGAVWFGHAGGRGLVDEIVLTVKGLVPVPWLEWHCHGGRPAVDWLMELLTEAGCVHCAWPQFVAATEANHDAAVVLTQTRTARTAAIALDQLSGAFEQAIIQVKQAWNAGNRADAAARIDEMLRLAELGACLAKPWRVTVAGAPNVGKSSLVNALAGYQRSVVAPVAGTTRDVVSATLAIDGWPVELLDTAGLRDRAGELEQAGIERARDALRNADLVVWLIDATADVPALPADVYPNLLLVANKCDLPAARSQVGNFRVSALTGEGIPALCAAISRKLVPNPPPPGAAVPISPAQVEELRQMRKSLEKPEEWAKRS